MEIISSGQFYAIHYNGKEHWLQGMKIGENGGPVGDKKYFDPDELNAALGKGNKKTASVGNNVISFDKYSYDRNLQKICISGKKSVPRDDLCLEKGNFFRYKLRIEALNCQKTDFIKDSQGGRNYGCIKCRSNRRLSVPAENNK